MHGTDDDWDCTIDETCPNLVSEPGWGQGLEGWVSEGVEGWVAEGVEGWAEAPLLGDAAGSHSGGSPPGAFPTQPP